MTSLRVAFAGTPEFALPPLRALLTSKHQLVGVLTQPDRPSGRGRKITPSPVKQMALDHQLPLAQPLNLKADASRSELIAWRPDVLIVVAYGLILPREVLTLPRLGCVNIHASLLPRWRGAAPIHRAILAGDSETGISIMQMDAGLDTGPVLLRRKVPITPQDTSGSLQDRLAVVGAEALLEALDALMSGTIEPQPQPSVGVTYAAKISKQEALIDWSLNAVEIDRKIRAFHPWPIAETRFQEEVVRIHAARPMSLEAYEIDVENADNEPTKAPIDSYLNQSGALLGLAGNALQVQCGVGILGVTQLQRPGRKPIAAADFANSIELSGQRFE